MISFDQIQIIDGDGFWGNINSGQTSSSINDFTLSVSSDVINGTQFPLQLILVDAQGYSRQETFNLIPRYDFNFFEFTVCQIPIFFLYK